MSEMQDIQAKFGNLFQHAEAMQQAAREQQSLAAQLLEDAHERIQQLETLNKELSKRVTAFNELPNKLGVLAYKGGEEAVAKALRLELGEVSATIELETKEALTPALAPLKEKISDALKAADLLSFQANRFSMKTFVIIGACALGALAICLFTLWVSLAWQRSEIESLKDEKAALSSEIEDMKTNIERLKSLGGKIEIGECPDSKTGKMRKCVAVQRTEGIAGYWTQGDKALYILRGY